MLCQTICPNRQEDFIVRPLMFWPSFGPTIWRAHRLPIFARAPFSPRTASASVTTPVMLRRCDPRLAKNLR